MNLISVTLNRFVVTSIDMSDQDRIKQLVKNSNRQIALQKQIKSLNALLLKLQREGRKLRIIKNSKSGFDYKIICYCGNKYDTDKDPGAALKIDRPQCRKCGERLEGVI